MLPPWAPEAENALRCPACQHPHLRLCSFMVKDRLDDPPGGIVYIMTPGTGVMESRVWRGPHHTMSAGLTGTVECAECQEVSVVALWQADGRTYLSMWLKD